MGVTLGNPWIGVLACKDRSDKGTIKPSLKTVTHVYLLQSNPSSPLDVSSGENCALRDLMIATDIKFHRARLCSPRKIACI